MICSKCGKEIKDDAQFCNFCGTSVEQPKNEIKKKKKTPVIILVAVLCLALIGGGLFFLLGKENPTEKTDTSRIEANLANWGYGCEVGENSYIWIPNEGIAKITKQTISLNEEPEIVYKSSKGYSDFVTVNNDIYCLASSYNQETEATDYVFCVFDTEDNQMYEFCSYASKGSYCTSLNYIDGKIYYAVDGSLAYIDTTENYKEGIDPKSLHSTSISTNKDGVLKVTNTGVYLGSIGDKGLKLLSLDGKLIKEYDELQNQKVSIWFEKDGYIFMSSEETNGKIYKLNIESGKQELFCDESSFSDNIVTKQINWYQDKCFVSFVSLESSGIWKYRVNTYSNDGDFISTISEGTLDDFDFVNITVMNDVMFLINPITGWLVDGDCIGIYELPSLKSIG